MTPTQLEGITKARLACNADLASRKEPLFDTDEEYIEWVCAMAGIKEFPSTAADSYVEQHADTDVKALEAKVDEALNPAPIEPTEPEPEKAMADKLADREKFVADFKTAQKISDIPMVDVAAGIAISAAGVAKS